jgi:hypothetical protein
MERDKERKTDKERYGKIDNYISRKITIEMNMDRDGKR